MDLLPQIQARQICSDAGREQDDVRRGTSFEASGVDSVLGEKGRPGSDKVNQEADAEQSLPSTG